MRLPAMGTLLLGRRAHAGVLEGQTGPEILRATGVKGGLELRCSDGVLLVRTAKALAAFDTRSGEPLTLRTHLRQCRKIDW